MWPVAPLQSPNHALAILAPMFGSTKSTMTTSLIRSLIPVSALTHEPFGSGLVVDADCMSSHQAFSLMAYLISNQLHRRPQNSQHEMPQDLLYKWVKKSTMFGEASFRSLEGPTSHALLESLFGLAVEAEDLDLAKRLISVGADPKTSRCRIKGSLMLLTPLEYACFMANVPLASELIRAGAVVDHIDVMQEVQEESDYEYAHLWRCNVIVLTLLGHQYNILKADQQEGLRNGIERVQDETSDDEEMLDEMALAKSDDRGRKGDMIDLIETLIKAGASVNAIGYHACTGSQLADCRRRGGDANFFWVEDHLEVAKKHSPLTMAARFGYKHVLRLLLQHGADVRFRVDGHRSALRECLNVTEYRRGINNTRRSWHEEHSYREGDDTEPLEPDIYDMVADLIAAGVDVNDHVPCKNSCVTRCKAVGIDAEDEFNDWSWMNSFTYGESDCQSALDLAMRSRSPRLIDKMIAYGARPTAHSTEIALELRSYELFRHLVALGSPLSHWMLDCGAGKDCGQADPTEVQQIRALALAAAYLGQALPLQELLRTTGSSYLGILDNCPGAVHKVLRRCCEEGFIETFRIILHSGVLKELSATSLGKLLPYSIADEEADVEGNEEMTDLLLDSGANVNGNLNNPPILKAIKNCDAGLVQRLLRAGASLSLPRNLDGHCDNCTNDNILVAAIATKDEDVIDEVLLAGADINELGATTTIDPSLEYSDGRFQCKCRSPLTMAIMMEDWSLVARLRSLGASVNSSCRNVGEERQRSALWAAIEYGVGPGLAKELIYDGADMNDLMAMKTAAMRYPDFFTSMLEKLKTTTVSGSTNRTVSLVFSQLCGNIFGYGDVEESDVEISLEAILQNSLVDANMKDRGMSIFSSALERYSCQDALPILGRLLQLGADPNTPIHRHMSPPMRCEYQTAMLIAIRSDRPENVELLLMHGGSLNEQNIIFRHCPLQLAAHLMDGGSLGEQNIIVRSCPLQLAARYGRVKIVEILLRRGADPNAVASGGQLSDGYQHEYEQEHIGTPIQEAVQHGNPEVVRLLLEHQAEVDGSTCSLPHTALQLACREAKANLAELLVEWGANINHLPAASHGATALQYAAMSGHLGLAHTLLEKGADVNAPAAEAEGRTALEGAAEYGRIDMIKLLMNAGTDISGEREEQVHRGLERAQQNGHQAAWQLLNSYLPTPPWMDLTIN